MREAYLRPRPDDPVVAVRDLLVGCDVEDTETFFGDA
jgi:hypothetical protein